MSAALNRGWFLMHRGWMASPDFQPEPFTEREAFAWSIERAAHSAHSQWFNGSQIALARGELVTSIRKMAATFQWGDKRVRGFTMRMVRCGKWAQRGAHPFTVLTVCNYEQYQAAAKAKGTAEGELGAHLGHTQGTQDKQWLTNGNELEAKELEAAPLARAPAQPIAQAFAAWQQASASTKWPGREAPLNASRSKGLSAILKAHGLDGWISGLQRALDSEWLNGPDPPPWFTLDFITKLPNFDKLDAGNYDRLLTSKAPSNDTGNAWLAARERQRGGIHSSPGHLQGAEPVEQLRLSSR